MVHWTEVAMAREVVAMEVEVLPEAVMGAAVQAAALAVAAACWVAVAIKVADWVVAAAVKAMVVIRVTAAVLEAHSNYNIGRCQLPRHSTLHRQSHHRSNLYTTAYTFLQLYT